jgi:hypothetical protein
VEVCKNGAVAPFFLLVSEGYLRDNKTYPLQVITVEFFRNLVAAAAFVGLGLMLLLLRLAR